MSRQPLTRETADPNAATAAASAFMRRGSNASLSSAAAAAALRARPMTPTNVAEVQSKRAVRRSPSVASMPGGKDRSSGRDLRRTPSVGSMIERTFRSPSPGGRSPMPRERNVPPVPSIPDDHILASRRAAAGQQRKGTTLQTQPFRTASEKMKGGGQHASWFGGATAGNAANVRRSDSVMHTSATAYEPRPGSVSPTPSINFSYPRGRVHSPSPSIDDQTLVYDANSRRMVPRAELLARSQSIRDVLERPKKKQQQQQQQDLPRSGSHLAKGTVGRTQAPALETPPVQPQAKPQPQPQPEPEPLEEQTTAAPASAAATAPIVAPGQPQSPAKKKKKKKKKKAPPAAAQAPAPVPVEAQAMDGKAERPEEAPQTKEQPTVMESIEREEPDEVATPQPITQQAATAVATAPVATVAAERQAQDNGHPPASTVRHARVQSESPVRSARFAPAHDQLAVRHEPPPRSVSPRKSAMKLSSARDASPSDDGSELSGRNLSPLRAEDSALSRKKSARVSWDDRNTVVVGESVQPHDTESPVIPSPQVKKPWHNIVTKYAKKEHSNLDEDETMAPRPALPLFGSVREKKSRETEERPLVRPLEKTRSSSGEATDAGQSSDAAIGAVLSQDQASRNAANISKYREPLPPVVQSREGDSRDEDLVSSSDDDLDTDGTELDEASASTTPRTTQHLTPEPTTPTKAAFGGEAQDGEVPTISVQQPSPRPQDPKDNAFSGERHGVPGTFPHEDSPVEPPEAHDLPVAHAVSTDALPPGQLIEPVEPSEALTSAAPPIMDDIKEEEEETDRCSVYSDAYEELDEVNGDGFMSLDAVVESPAGSKMAKKIHEKAMAQPADDAQESRESSGSPIPPALVNSSDDWEKAKSYWRSLSTEQRRLLEIEALSETGEDADVDQPATPDDKRMSANGSLEASPVSVNNHRSYQIMPGTKWSDKESEVAAMTASAEAAQPRTRPVSVPRFRQSMRSEQAAPVSLAGQQTGSMRKSMRGSAPAPITTPEKRARQPQHFEPDVNLAAASAAGAGMKKSLRTSASNGDTLRPSLNRSGRPVSYNPPPTGEPFKSHKRNLSADNLGPPGALKPSLRRKGSDDSVSSFKRARASSGSEHGFRMSMRAAPQEPPSPSARGSGRFSLRSLSPPAFRRTSLTSTPVGVSSFGTGRMRQSLRAESVDASRSRLSANKRSSGMKKGNRRSSSRFADSSDEDEGGPSFFSSRFADSSDEEEASRPRSKGKGLPKSMRSNRSSSMAAASAMGMTPVVRDASPDLPDSDDGAAHRHEGPLTNGQAQTLRRSRSGRGTLMSSQASEGAEQPRARGGLMSILRRKKDPSNRITREVSESAARRDTKFERSPEQLAQIRSNSLHKRETSWPLPDEEGGTSAEGSQGAAVAVDKTRPATANGPPPATNGFKKSAFLRRRSTSQGVTGLSQPPQDDDVPPVPDLPPARKKKFGALRKMLGIHD
ncbi:casein kinase I isoform epsilon [Purpureocillium lavendulum]|uniref:Casein kinase I isoform epsilon n=1 Tax=Purpureocillium lavendulum TaxID=1247861 RepID=A0AB34FYV0_9HYPO|nr:casein kinase I isoform epsilon [Purpureocillium lavendulum]